MRKHGGDWNSHFEQFGEMPLDFSANLSPLGMPQAVREAAVHALEHAEHYPDPYCRSLRAAITTQLGIPVSHCLCGNGAADLLFRMALAVKPQTALLAVPTFSEYEAALKTVNCSIRYYHLSEAEEFALTDRFLGAVTPDIDLVILCSPNNPTGLTVSPALMQKIILRCEENGALLAVDSCFQDFLDNPEAHSLVSELAEHPNVVVIKAFTKLYAMPGLRLGYALSSNTTLLERMRDMGQPWPVSCLAQEAGIAAVSETAYVQSVRSLIQVQRRRMIGELRTLGLRVIPGEANFLLFQGKPGLKQALQKEGILILCCADYIGLDETWYRIAIRTESENTRLLAALKKVIG